MHDVGIHPSLLRAIGPGEGAAGGFLFVSDPPMGLAIGVALTLFAGNAEWCWRATSQQTEELTRQSGMALAASIKSLYHSLTAFGSLVIIVYARPADAGLNCEIPAGLFG